MAFQVELTSDVKPGERSGAASVIFADSLYVFGGSLPLTILQMIFTNDLIQVISNDILNYNL